MFFSTALHNYNYYFPRSLIHNGIGIGGGNKNVPTSEQMQPLYAMKEMVQELLRKVEELQSQVQVRSRVCIIIDAYHCSWTAILKSVCVHPAPSFFNQNLYFSKIKKVPGLMLCRGITLFCRDVRL